MNLQKLFLKEVVLEIILNFKYKNRKRVNNMDIIIKVILIYGFIAIAYEFLKIKITKRKCD